MFTQTRSVNTSTLSMLSSPDRTELSESYFHLSLDHSSYGSSENLSQLSPGSFTGARTLQLLSKARDMDRLFAEHSPRLESPYTGNNDITYPEASFSSHSTPLSIEPKSTEKRERIERKDTIHSRHQQENVQKERNHYGRNGFRKHRNRARKQDPSEMVRKLVSDFGDALGECIQGLQKSPDSSSSEIDDTFDKTELLSPLSSPHSSRDDDTAKKQKESYFQKDSKENFKESLRESLEKEREEEKETHNGEDQFQKEQQDREVFGGSNFSESTEVEFEPASKNPPRVSLEDLTTESIDIQPKRGETPRPDSAETIESLQAKIRQYQLDNEELHNELQFVKSQLKGTPKATCKESRDHDIPEQFKPYYDKLHLDAVNDMSVSEMRRLIKNVMLSLLISDFEHLPTMMPKIGKYISLTTEFLDSLHGQLYDLHMTPLEYLRNYSLSIDGLGLCLKDMLAVTADGASETFI